MSFDLAGLRSKVGTAPALVALAALALLAATWIPGALFDRNDSPPAVTQVTGTPGTGIGGSALPRSAERDPFDGPGAAVDISLKLLAVLALVYVALSVLRRYSLGAGLGLSARTIQVLECTNLAPNRSLYVVNIEGRRLLIGVTQTGMSTLAELDEQADPLAPAPPAP